MTGKCTIALAVCLSVSLAASAALIPVAGDTNDRQISASSMPWVGQPEARVGVGSTEGSCAVFVFELPVLPAGETVDTADLAFSVTGGNNWGALFEHGMDLYGVRMAAASAVEQSDYYKGAYGGDAAATAIEDYIVYEGEDLNQGDPGEVGRHDTDAAGEAALGAWLASLYASSNYDANGTNYAFLRVNARDDLTSTYRYWSVATANNATEANRPVLTISTIPEPATIGLLAMGAAAVIRRRK